MIAASRKSDLTPDGTWSLADGLVFIGVSLRWRSRLSDLEGIEKLAMTWEEQFQDWRRDESAIFLSAQPIGYNVQLSPGQANFTIESAQGCAQAEAHVEALINHLESGGREKRVALVEAQFLFPSADDFNALLSRAEQGLFSRTFHKS